MSSTLLQPDRFCFAVRSQLVGRILNPSATITYPQLFHAPGIMKVDALEVKVRHRSKPVSGVIPRLAEILQV
jgi:hypothetical protein